jgi:hypothetical protein
MNRRPADRNNPPPENSAISRVVPVIVVFATVSGFMALAWYAYHTGSQSLNEEDLLVIEADKTPVKEKPTDPGGMQFPNQDKTIFETFAGGSQQPPKVERVLPTPEQPMAKKIDTSETKTWINEKLHKQKEEDKAAAVLADKAKAEQVIGGDEMKAQPAPAPEQAKPADTATPTAAPTPAPAVASVAKDPAAEKLAAEKKAAEEKAAAEKKATEQKAAEEKLAAEKKAADEKAAAEKKAAEDKAATDKKAAEQKITEDKLKADKLAAEKKAADEKAAADKLAAEKKAAEHRAAEEKLKAEKLAAEKKAAEEKAAAEKKAAEQKGGTQVIQAGAMPKDTAKEKPSAKTGAHKVQLGAYRSEKEAQDAWNKMKSAHKEFANMQPVIVKADLGAKGIYYRLRTGTFANTAEAKAFCGTMSILGQACILPTE